MIRNSANGIAMACTPGNWPMWPILPVKRSQSGSNWPELGFILDNGLARVYLGNFLELKGGLLMPQVANLESYGYTDMESLFADGWIVD